MENDYNNHLNWPPARWATINNAIHDEAALLRRARRDEGAGLQGSGRIFTLFGDHNCFVDHVAGYKVDTVKPGTPLRISAGQTLVPTTISVSFQLSPEQFNDENIAMVLATKAAYLVALAEDYVLLHGAEAADALDKLNVSHDEHLKDQVGLFGQAQKQVHQPVLNSILDAIEQLQGKSHHGEYCAIVSPDLYQEAFTSRCNTSRDAPIYEIRTQLKKGGFMYSPAAPPKTGVVFSLGGRTIDLAVTVDAKAEEDIPGRGVAILRVVEQLRLRINDETAVVALGEAETVAPAMKAGKAG